MPGAFDVRNTEKKTDIELKLKRDQIVKSVKYITGSGSDNCHEEK